MIGGRPVPSERWQQIEQLYHAARERAPAERAVFLDEACRGDAALRREVQSLLGSDRGEFLETPALEAAAQLMSTSGASAFKDRTIGVYQVQALLGAGGMGEVYRARDTKLGRDVAIKILQHTFTADPDRQARFEREARVLASLNHPNIGAIYDVGRDCDIEFLVLEYLDGETLAARLGKGALARPDALRIAIDIASALDTAHRHGIVHRDLKPGNVILTTSGAKLLDFGLAKRGSAGVSTGAIAKSLPRASTPLTAHGTLLGTFQYMAPEQIEGEEADARTDIFAFGAVLYEMLTGQRAFQGKSQASLFGAILKDDPPPLSTVQPLTPPTLDRLVRKCLAKDRDDRWQTARDLLDELRWVAQSGSAAGVTASVVSRRRSREWFAWTTAAVLGAITVAAGAFAVVHLRERSTPVEPVQFTIAAPENSTLARPAQFAISPDGRQVVLLASASEGPAMLWVHPLATLPARALPGTEGANQPF
jgi:serine/threonine protein kinase